MHQRQPKVAWAWGLVSRQDCFDAEVAFAPIAVIAIDPRGAMWRTVGNQIRSDLAFLIRVNGVGSVIVCKVGWLVGWLEVVMVHEALTTCPH